MTLADFKEILAVGLLVFGCLAAEEFYLTKDSKALFWALFLTIIAVTSLFGEMRGALTAMAG